MKEIFPDKIDRSPQTPGIYILSDRGGRVLYVGKSINIRQRLLQHAASLKAGWSDRNHRRIYHVSDACWYETGSELYALLLEDQLVKKYWPVGNVRQKEYLEYAYLAFSIEALPRLLVIEAKQRDHYNAEFGPFRNTFYARDLAELVQDRFRLRTCVTAKDGGCARWEIHKCSGPCRSQEAAERYLRSIDRAIESLRSNDIYFIRFIENRIKIEAQKKEFEKAAHFHAMLRRYEGFIKRQKFHEMFRRHGCLIREIGRWPNTFKFFQGRLIERNGGVFSNESFFDDCDDYESIQSEWRIIDRANVIYQWMRGRRGECEMAVIDRRFFRNPIHEQTG